MHKNFILETDVRERLNSSYSYWWAKQFCRHYIYVLYWYKSHVPRIKRIGTYMRIMVLNLKTMISRVAYVSNEFLNNIKFQRFLFILYCVVQSLCNRPYVFGVFHAWKKMLFKSTSVGKNSLGKVEVMCGLFTSSCLFFQSSSSLLEAAICKTSIKVYTFILYFTNKNMDNTNRL